MRCLFIFRRLCFRHADPIERGRDRNRKRTKTATIWHAEGKTGAVAVGGKDAREPAWAMLKSGGNAADAAAVPR